MAGTPLQIKSVIFDLDDTLIDWSGQSVSWPDFLRPRSDQIHHFLTSDGLSLPPQDEFYDLVSSAIGELWNKARETGKLHSIGVMLCQLLADLGNNLDQIDIDEVLVHFDWQPFPGVKLFDDSLEVLDALKLKHYKLGLLTNSFLPMWMRDIELEAFGLLDYFDARLTAADVGYIKPHPAIFEEILSFLGTDPEEAVFVGDRPKNDIAGANEAGMISILITPPHVNHERGNVTPDYAIEKLSELLPLLSSIDSQLSK